MESNQAEPSLHVDLDRLESPTRSVELDRDHVDPSLASKKHRPTSSHVLPEFVFTKLCLDLECVLIGLCDSVVSRPDCILPPESCSVETDDCTTSWPCSALCTIEDHRVIERVLSERLRSSSHCLQEIAFFDLRSSSFSHRLCQLLSRFQRLFCSNQCPVSSVQVDRLFVQRYLHLQQAGVGDLLFPQCFCSFASLLLALG